MATTHYYIMLVYLFLIGIVTVGIVTVSSFSSLVPVYVSANSTVINPTPPIMKDVNGNELTSAKAGQMVMLSTHAINLQDNDQPFVLIMEVRDENGTTVYLEWQTGTLNPDGQAEISLSWTPDTAGEYRLRTFMISGFLNPQILTIVATSTVIVKA